MKAFISHSSKDKGFAKSIFDYLGPARCEYDEYTFDFTLNTQAIRKALARCDIFVLLLSANSTKSTFVSEEMRTALEQRARGSIKSVLIFAIDQTSYQALPEWMREINVVQNLKKAMVVARKIEQELFTLELERISDEQIYIPREDEEANLRRVLKQPPGVAPVAVHAVGFVGIGRKTFIKRQFSAIFPRSIQTYIEFSISRFEGINEFYRRLHDHIVVCSIDEQIKKFEKFAGASEDEQVEKLTDLMDEVFHDNECILIEDKGGVYTDEGDYEPFMAQLLEKLKGANRPLLTFAQTRMMPFKLKEKRPYSYHVFLRAFDEDKISELAAFALRAEHIDYSAKQLVDLCSLLDGAPINVKLAVKAIKSYGLPAFLADPSLLIEWKRKRAEDFLSMIEFSELETELLAAFYDYRFLQFETLRAIITDQIDVLTQSLRKLEDFCCIERTGAVYAISQPIHDAVGRNKKFQKPDGWRRAVATKIVQSVAEYGGDEHAPLVLLEAGAMASIVSGESEPLLSRYVLPSYFLTLAHRSYIDERWKDAREFCRHAWERREQLSIEGRIETLRIYGLVAIRQEDTALLEFVIDELRNFGSRKVAQRHTFFLRGFSLRRKKRFDEAEREFLSAHKLAPKNMSINRELANLYRHQKDFIEGEGYARAAFSVAPTNPFIIDVFLECLLGKAELDLPVDQREIEQLFCDLERYGDVPGSSFYQTRIAHDLFRKGDKPNALAAATKAVDRTSEFLPCRFLRAEIYLSMCDVAGAKKDLGEINRILEKRGGFSEEEEGRAVELEVRILTQEKKFKEAREKLQFSPFMPRRVEAKLRKALAFAINKEPEKADSKSREWARKYLS